MAEWFTEGRGAADSDDDGFAVASGPDGGQVGGDEGSLEDFAVGSMLRFASVADVTSFFRGPTLASVLTRLGEYGGSADAAAVKNALTKDDPEYEFVQECSQHALTIEVEKSKVHKFIRDHYGVHFPELGTLCADSVNYARLVKAIGNDAADIAPHIETMLEVLPSQLVCAVCAAGATTAGRTLNDGELSVVLEACEELIGLEDAKQILLEYIQSRTVLICPNLSALLGTAIASQLFAVAGSVAAIASMEPSELASLGGNRSAAAAQTGVKIKSAGFLINADLVACHTPELRQKALRSVAAKAVNVARIDDHRRAADNTEGLRAREELKRRMLEWTDPMVQQVQSKLRGLANKTYERRTRRRAVDLQRARRGAAGAGARGSAPTGKGDR